MSNKKIVETTLVMPQDMPLFNYHLSFQNLRSLVENLNLQISSNTQQIQSLKQQIASKLHKQKLNQQQQMLNDCLRLGISSLKIVEGNQGYEKNNRKDEKQMNNMQKFGWKMGKLTQVLEHVVNLSEDLKQKVNNNGNEYMKNLDDISKRVQQKINANFESVTKNINLYFVQTNKKVAALQTQINSHNLNTTATLQSIKDDLNKKISGIQLQGALKGINQQVKKSILVDLQNDQMKRLATLNQLNNKLQTFMSQSQLKNKAIKQTVKQISQRVGKSLSIQTFQGQKHKIYEKLSEYKSKIDDLGKKNQEFIDFRKNFYEAMEKIKQNLMQQQEGIKKLKQSAAKNAPSHQAQLLASLDPHLICQINNQVKLHQKQIGKLQKQVIYLQNQLQSVRSSTRRVPQGNSSQTAETIIKTIKQYMANLDFQGRVKKLEKQIHDVSKKGDMISELDKKIYMLSKDIDIGALMKQIKRKADEDSTRKDFKVLDSKLQKLFDFYRQIRKQTEEFFIKSAKTVNKQPHDNAAMTTKRLYSVNCISCTPRRVHGNRNYSKNKIQASIDQSADQFRQLKNSMYVKGTLY